MRPAQKSNRSRGRGNRKGGGGGGGNNLNRVFDSAGPEGKVRGTPQQIIDKYLSLARDAQTSGDRVAAENFLQHAEHYQRILIQATATQEQARREAQEAATDQQPDRNTGGPIHSDPASQPQPQVQPQQQAPQPQPQAAAAPAPIEGMTTIDSGEMPSGLVTDDEAVAQSQPRSNGSGRGRRPRKPPATAEATAAEAPVAVAGDAAPAPSEG